MNRLSLCLAAVLCAFPMRAWAQAGEPGAPVIQVAEGSSGNYQVVTDKITVGNSATVKMSTSFPQGQIFYTVDGSPPSFTSTRYQAPFTIGSSASLRAVAYNVDFTESKTKTIQIEVVPKYTLQVRADDGAVLLDPPGGSYLSNTVVTLTAVDTNGFFFVGWQGAVTGTNHTVQVTMTTNKSITAVFHTTVNLTSTGSGRIISNRSSAAIGEWIVLSAVPDPGHFFGAWGGALQGNLNPTYFQVENATQTVSAVFGALAENEVALTAQVDGPAGIVRLDPAKNVFQKGETVSLRVDLRYQPVPDTFIGRLLNGYAFKGWSGDLAGLQHPLNLILTQDIHLTAHIEYVGNWIWPLAAHPGGRVAIGNDGTVYISAKAKLTALHPVGTPKWTKDFDLTGLSNPSIGPSGTIYLGGADGSILAISPRGELLWRFSAPESSQGGADRSPSVRIGAGETLYSKSLLSGKVYEVRQGNLLRTLPSWPSIAPDGTLHYGVETNTVAEKITGELKWSLPIPVPQIIGEDGTLYTFSSDSLTARDANGELLWSRSYNVRQLTLGEGGMLFIRTHNATVALNAGGEALWTNSPGQLATRSTGGTYLVHAEEFRWDVEAYVQGIVRTMDADGQPGWFAQHGIQLEGALSGPPVIGPNGVVYYGLGWGLEQDIGHIISIRGDSLFARSSWSMEGGNPQNTGRSEPLVRTLQVEVNGSGTVENTPTGDTQELLGQVTLHAVPGEGHGFLRWSGDVDSTENPLQLIMDSHKKVVAVFEPKPTITIAMEADGVILQVVAQPGQNYFLQSSGDLVQWNPFVAFEGSVSIDLPLRDDHQYFRVIDQ